MSCQLRILQLDIIIVFVLRAQLPFSAEASKDGQWQGISLRSNVKAFDPNGPLVENKHVGTPFRLTYECARSSVVEHFTDNEKVEGPIPSARTSARAHMFTLNSLPFVMNKFEEPVPAGAESDSFCAPHLNRCYPSIPVMHANA